MEQDKNQHARPIFLVGFGVILAKLAMLGLTWKSLPPELPWLYSLPWGEGQLVRKIFIMYQSLGESLGWVVLWLMAKKVKPGDGEVLLTIMMGGLMTLVLILVSFIKIMGIFL